MKSIRNCISRVLVLALLLSGFGLADEAFERDLQEYLSQQAGGQTAQQAEPSLPGDLTVGYVASDEAKLNPFLCEERDLISINQLVFESVVELDDTQKPVPLLADSWTHDGKNWTFKLRSNIQFHNGMELVAEDVVASYNQFLQSGSTNPYFGRLGLIETMYAEDAFTLHVTARYEGMITLYAMTFPVVQRATLTDVLPRGTGPYWYISYSQDASVRLESNPLWWKKQPAIQSVVGIRYVSTGDALEALLTDQVNCVSTRAASASLTRKLSAFSSNDYSTSTYELMIPNLSDASALSDVRIRQAVMYAIDRATLVSNAYLDMAQQSEVPVTPGTWLYETQSAVYYYSPERALQLLNQAGWTDLTGDTYVNRLQNGMLTDLNLTIVTYNETNSTVRQNAAEQIAVDLNAVGIHATVSVLSASQVGSAIQKGSFDLALIGLNLSEVPDLVPMFSKNGSVNFSGSHTEEMDAILLRTVYAATEEEMRQAYSDLQLYVVDRLPILGLLFRTGTVLSTRSLAGLSGMREYDVFNGLEFVEAE